jgi:hypothetical protein
MGSLKGIFVLALAQKPKGQIRRCAAFAMQDSPAWSLQSLHKE